MWSIITGMSRFAWLPLLMLLSLPPAFPQIVDSPAAAVANIPVNYTESLAGNYKLPDPLVLTNGEKVKDPKTWFAKRRPEILRLVEESQFGRSPAKPAKMSFDVFDKASAALDGKATRRQVTIYFTADKHGPKMDLLLYLPAGAPKPVPVLLNISFTANSSGVADPGIRPGEVWNAKEKKRQPAASSRSFGRLNVSKFLDAGFGVATFYYGDVDPDFLGGIPDGIRSAYMKPGAEEPEPGEWGAIAAWAWGASRALDYLETDTAVDAKRVAITGVSRLGKTVLWAGARDTRFAMVIASCSGEGGAALSRRNYGETIAHLVAPGRYPYQFAGNYAKYGPHVDEFPVDSHMLLSLIAPRPLLLQTGNTDKWSDPYGEFLAAVAAAPVYRLLGRKEQLPDKMPPPGVPLLNPLGFLMHDGGHGTIPADWDVFLEFMKKYL